MCSSDLTYGSEEVWAQADNRKKADIVGVGDGVLEILNWDVSTGRLITREDGEQRLRGAVVTTPLVESLFPGQSPEAVVGQTIFVGRKPYAILGVLEKRDMMGIHFGFSWEYSVFVPQLTAEKREGRPEQARFFVGLSEDAAYNSSVVALGNAALLNNHRGVEDFESMDF